MPIADSDQLITLPATRQSEIANRQSKGPVFTPSCPPLLHVLAFAPNVGFLLTPDT